MHKISMNMSRLRNRTDQKKIITLSKTLSFGILDADRFGHWTTLCYYVLFVFNNDTSTLTVHYYDLTLCFFMIANLPITNVGMELITQWKPSRPNTNVQDSRYGTQNRTERCIAHSCAHSFCLYRVCRICSAHCARLCAVARVVHAFVWS